MDLHSGPRFYRPAAVSFNGGHRLEGTGRVPAARTQAVRHRHSVCLATLVVSAICGVLVSSLYGDSPNPAAAGLGAYSIMDLVWFLARTFVQLIGEEVVSILPLLAVLWLCVTRFGLNRRLGVIIAIAVSTLWFSAMHLPTYDWNIVQCLGIIGTARVVMTLAYLVTRNLWVSTIAHVTNDWALFLFSF